MPLLERPWILGTAAAYVLVTLAIGAWAARRTRSAGDFFIAGQRLGLVVTALATMEFSGFVFLGGAGLTYRIGVASMWIIAPVAFTAALLCWTVGKRLRLLAEAREVYTVPEALAARYRSRLVQGLAAVAVVVGAVGYLAAQVLALGVLVETVLGTRELLGEWSPIVAMASGLGIVVLYHAAGGMVAGAYTDVFQGAVMMAAAAAVFVQALRVSGGLAAMTRAIAASDAFGPRFVDPLGGAPALTAFGFFFVFGVGVLGQPHMLHKFFMLGDPGKLRWFPATLALSQVVCLLVWIGVGLAVPALVAAGRLAPLANPDDAAPRFLLAFAPEALAGLVLTGVLAAIMSTSGSLINIAAAAVVRDVPRALGRRLPDELRAGRVAVVALAVVAALLAWSYGDLIALLGTFAFGTFAAALAPALAIGLNWRRVTAPAAASSIAVGLVANLGLELAGRRGALDDWLAPGALPSAVALAASFLTLLVVTWWTSRAAPPALEPDVEAVLEM